MKPNPCYRCSERTVEPNCHDTCERHFESLAENEKIKKERRKDYVYLEYRDNLMMKKGKAREK